MGVLAEYDYDAGGPLDRYIKAHVNTSAVVALYGDQGLDLHIKKLSAGRIDIVIESTTVMDSKLAEMGLSDAIVIAGTFGVPSLLYVACSPARASSKVYVQLLTEGIREMRKSGELDEILSNYGVTDWK